MHLFQMIVEFFVQLIHTVAEDAFVPWQWNTSAEITYIYKYDATHHNCFDCRVKCPMHRLRESVTAISTSVSHNVSNKCQRGCNSN